MENNMVFVVKVKVRCTMTGDVTKYIVSFVMFEFGLSMIFFMFESATQVSRFLSDTTRTLKTD